MENKAVKEDWKKYKNVPISIEYHKKLKELAFKLDKPMTFVVEKAIDDAVKSINK